MAHNFPIDQRMIFVDRLLTKEEIKELYILAIKGDVRINQKIFDVINTQVRDYRICFDYDNEIYTHSISSTTNKECFFITYEQFLAFLRGEGDLNLVKEPIKITVKLNNSYDAVVTKKNLTVGCQSFEFSVIEKLYNVIQIVKNDMEYTDEE